MRVFLDSVIIIYYLDHSGEFQARAAARLAACHAAGDEVAVSDLVRMECRVNPIRKGDTIRLTVPIAKPPAMLEESRCFT
jgi:predicted nucleic acid-binding protein